MVANTARQRARTELTREIRDAARRQLTEVGSAGLSLRAVAREIGMASSAVYRYFPSRDDLLTALIIDAYDAVATAAATAEGAVPRADVGGRWLATTRGVRGWAVDHPQEYALIFGSPVPGYTAPTDTVDPAARIPLLIVQILLDAQLTAMPPSTPMPATVRADLATLRNSIAPPLTDEQTGRAVMAWSQLIGSISFEIFGHLNNVIHDYPAYFDYQMRELAAGLGLGAPNV